MIIIIRKVISCMRSGIATQ